MLAPIALLNVVHIHEEPHGKDARTMGNAHLTRRTLLGGATAVALAAATGTAQAAPGAPEVPIAPIAPEASIAPKPP